MTPDITIVIPAYNESRRLPKTLELIFEYFQGKESAYEIIVVSDGSSDETVAVANKYTEQHPVTVVEKVINQGKGAAVRTGVHAAKGKTILITDADSSTPIEELEKLQQDIDRYDVVIGSRHVPDSKIHVTQPFHRVVLSRASNLLIRALLCPGIYDTQCGFKLFRQKAAKDIFEQVTLNRFGFDFESIMIAQRMGYRVRERGVDWYNDTDTKVRAGKEAVRTLADLLRVKWRMLTGQYHFRRSALEEDT